MVNENHYIVQHDTLPCLICAPCKHSKACIGGVYCQKRKVYVQYQKIEHCDDREIEN